MSNPTPSVDPYGQWALHTKLRRFRQTRIVDFLVELNAPVTEEIKQSFEDAVLSVIAPLRKIAARPPTGLPLGVPPEIQLTMPDAYLQVMPCGSTSRFITLRMSVETSRKGEDVDWGIVAQAVQAVLVNRHVIRVQVGQPNYAWRDSPEKPVQEAPGAGKQGDPQTTPVVLGLLGDAIPFAHAALRGERKGDGSRVVAVWDQGRRPDQGAWAVPDRFSYGAELSASAMTGLIQQFDGDEDAIYAALESAGRVSPLHSRVSHGGMILPLLAGAKHAPVPRWSNPDDERASIGEPLLDVASEAPVIGVTFPTTHTNDHSGRWMAVNALDGLRYIMSRAAQYRSKDGKAAPVAINLSYGALAGAHDGTSMLESAINELVVAHRNRLAIVLAAGNSHGTRRAPDGDSVDPRKLPHTQPGGLHARFDLHTAGQEHTLTLFAPPDKQEETYLEIWMHRRVDGKTVPLEEGQFPAITVTAPDGQEFSGVPGTGVLYPAVGGHPPAIPLAGLYLQPKVPQSTQRSMALLVIAPTQAHSRLPFAASGRWTVRITNWLDQSLAIDAYVERDDTTVGARRDQAAHLVATAGETLCDTDTLSDVATGSRVFRVGALQDVGADAEGAWVSRYSAEGHSAAGHSAVGPELSALADQGVARPGIRVSGSQSGMVVRANGTSLAAPQATRWIANRLAQTPRVSAVRREVAGSTDPRKGVKLLP